MRLLGLDPGLRHTGWGVIEAESNRLRHLANGVIDVPAKGPLSDRLRILFAAVLEVIEAHGPDEAAVEETFVNRNPDATLRLGQARGVVLLAPAHAGLSVAEYAANRVKKAVTGVGHAQKDQIGMMVERLLPGSAPAGPDAADALAVAICHAHYRAAPGHAGREAAL